MKLLVAASLAVAATMASAQSGPWPDFESRIQYAYYTEDSRTLANLAQLLATDENRDPWRDYYLALANYRFASLTGVEPSARESAADRCADAAERSSAALPRSAEPASLQAACLEMLSKLKPVRAPMAMGKARKRLALALRLAPANPRALLMEAAGADSRQVEQRLRKAIVRFEAERQAMASGPVWGGADAYLALGTACLARGDVLAARDAAERALLIAPEFVAARKLLAHITSD